MYIFEGINDQLSRIHPECVRKLLTWIVAVEQLEALKVAPN